MKGRETQDDGGKYRTIDLSKTGRISGRRLEKKKDFDGEDMPYIESTKAKKSLMKTLTSSFVEAGAINKKVIDSLK